MGKSEHFKMDVKPDLQGVMVCLASCGHNARWAANLSDESIHELSQIGIGAGDRAELWISIAERTEVMVRDLKSAVQQAETLYHLASLCLMMQGMRDSGIVEEEITPARAAAMLKSAMAAVEDDEDDEGAA